MQCSGIGDSLWTDAADADSGEEGGSSVLLFRCLLLFRQVS